MSDFKIDTLELEAFQSVIEQAAGTVSLAARGVGNKYAGLIVREAQRRVPVRTGTLRGSIHQTPTNAAAGVAMAGVAADAPYAGFVEFGTSRMAPRPYLTPAFRMYRKDYTKELGEIAANLIGRGGKTLIRGQRERFSLEQQLVAGSWRPGRFTG